MQSHRNVLEVLKFLEAKDILKGTSCVSQQWLLLSNSNEIWHCLCDLEAISPADIASYQHIPKLAYEQLIDREIFNLVIGDKHTQKLFDCRTHQTLAVVSNPIDTTGSAVMVKEDEAFFTGNGDSKRQALLVNFSTSQITNYPDSLDIRGYHASVRIKRTVYLFGGGATPTAEKCTLASKEWSWLLPMPVKRSGFTPCVRKQRIYLCGGGVSVCHVFDTRTNIYEELQLTIPGNSWCIASFVDQDLILENARMRSKWSAEKKLCSFKSRVNPIMP